MRPHIATTFRLSEYRAANLQSYLEQLCQEQQQEESQQDFGQGSDDKTETDYDGNLDDLDEFSLSNKIERDVSLLKRRQETINEESYEDTMQGSETPGVTLSPGHLPDSQITRRQSGATIRSNTLAVTGSFHSMKRNSLAKRSSQYYPSAATDQQARTLTMQS